LTVLRHREAQPRPAPTASADSTASSVRLERAHVTVEGRLVPEAGVSLAVPLDGVPTIETEAFVEVPQTRVGLGRAWYVAEGGRPPHTWQAVGTDMVNGTSCL